MMAVKMFDFAKKSHKLKKMQNEIELAYITIYQSHPDDLKNRMTNTGFRNDLERLFSLFDEGIDILRDLSDKNYIDHEDVEVPF